MPDIIESLPVIAKVSEINKEAEEIKAKRALPPKPGDRVKFSDLQAWLALLPEGAEERVTIWVYRMEPIINRQLVDPTANNNIDIIYGNFNTLTEERIRNNHGGGTYKFVVKDEDKPKMQLGGFFEAKLVIDMMEFPPKLDLREVEWDNPKNKGYKSWARAKRLINDANMPMIEKVSEPSAVTTGVDANMLKMMLDFTAKMSDKEQVALKRQIGGEDATAKNLNELLLEKIKQEDPNKQMGMVVSLITAMKSMQPEIKPDNTLATIMPMFMTMMQQMNESANRNMTLMIEMMKSNKSEPKEETDELDKLQKLLAIAKEIKGGGSSSSSEKTMGETIMETVRELGPSVLNLTNTIMMSNAAAKGVNVPQSSVANQPVDPMSQINKVNQDNIQHQEQQRNNVTTMQLPQNQVAQLIMAMQEQIFNHLVGEGWEFGVWVAQGYGDPTAAGLANMGVDKLLEAAKSVPDFWQRVVSTYGEEHFKGWLKSLCNYKQIVEQMDKEENGDITQ